MTTYLVLQGWGWLEVEALSPEDAAKAALAPLAVYHQVDGRWVDVRWVENRTTLSHQSEATRFSLRPDLTIL